MSGALDDPLQSENFNVRFKLSGSTLADLYRVIGVVLPETPPYSLSGQLGREGSVWSYRDFKGAIGDSDLGGTLGNPSVFPEPAPLALRAAAAAALFAIAPPAALLALIETGPGKDTDCGASIPRP